MLDANLHQPSNSRIRKSHTALIPPASPYREAYTLYLFTHSDFKTIVIPQTLFGICTALSASSFDLPQKPSWLILTRTPFVLIWTWINLLPFAIDNQRQKFSIQEDALNKPWRPLPSGRMTSLRAWQWMLGLYPVAVLVSVWLGGMRQCVILMVLGIWYNDFGGADNSPLIRNFINACGFLCYTSGAMEVAYSDTPPMAFNPRLLRWLGVIGGVVISSVHSQDLYDQAGDSIRGRRTMPLVIGDWPSRISIAGAVAIWTAFGRWFWQVQGLVCVPVVLLGVIVVIRTVSSRGVEEDKWTFKFWNAWLVALYALPLFVK